jgi:hypothetical protein
LILKEQQEAKEKE